MEKMIVCGLIGLFMAACSTPNKTVKSSGNERANAAKAQSEMSREIN